MDLVGMGKRIEKLRISSNLSRKILSEYLSISEKELATIERGKRKTINKEIISRIADLYFCSENYIINGSDEIEGRIPFDYSDHDKYRLEGIARVFSAVRERQEIEDIDSGKEFRKQMWSELKLNNNKSEKVRAAEVSESLNIEEEKTKNLEAEEIRKQRWTGLNIDLPKTSKQTYTEEKPVETKEEREQREFEEIQWDEYFFNDFNPYGL